MNIDEETAIVANLFATIKHGSDPNVVTQTLAYKTHTHTYTHYTLHYT